MRNFLLTLTIISFASLVVALSSSAHEEGQVVVNEIKPSLKEVVASKAAEVRTKAEAIKASASAKVAELKEKRASSSSELKKKIQENTENLRLQREAKKEELKLQFKSKREQFQQKLETIKDDRKKVVVSRLDTTMAAMNKRVTDHHTNVLERLISILDKLNNRVTKAESNGVDVSSVEDAISVARTQISNAQNVVATQSGKQYIISIEDESNLGQAVSTTKQLLMSDLKESREAVASARSAVEAALKSLSSLKGVDDVE